MKNTAYDRDRATRLVPLLRSITREIRERSQVIEALEADLRVIRGGSTGERANEYRSVQASLASHRRGLRLARLELERLGCTLDESHPLRILIPGDGGDVRTGFEWTGGEDAVELTAVKNPA